MADLQRLIDEFAADYEAGRRADVAALLDSVPADQRQELAEKLDSYLMQAPRRRWDPAAYEGSLAQAAVERVYESIEGVSGTWPELLPRLRDSARIKRRVLVERLAGALGADSKPQIEKVGSYYHQMEHGMLPAEGVSNRVIEALAAIVGASADAIRVAGARAGDEIAGGAAFARTAITDDSYGAESPAHRRIAADAPASPGAEPRRDEIDALFLDG
jgi:hypothetical protein